MRKYETEFKLKVVKSFLDGDGGEKERFAAAYHPYGPVGEAMNLDFPALTFLYAEIMASAGGPPTHSVFPVFRTRPVTASEAGTLSCPVLVVGGTEDPLFSAVEMTEVR